MTTITATPTASQTAGHVWTAIEARIAAAIRATLRRMKERHDYRTMLERDDAMLRDMGVTRNDVRRALSEAQSWH
jgi:uncharacterized protein YjiS (DUF1127 family)